MKNYSTAPVAVVTGAAGGLGRVIVQTLLLDGFRVAALDLNCAALLDVFALEVKQRRVLPLTCDITDEGAVEAAIDAIGAEWSRLDALVNNAGIEPRHAIGQLDMSVWDATFAVNVRAPMMLIKHSLPFWERQHGGSVVCVGSRTWQSGSSTTSYGASKAALIGLMTSVANMLGPIGVTANVVAPSFVRTPLNATRGDHAFIEEFAVRFAEMSPLQRLIEPIDVAYAIAFLVSSRARNITGEVINVAAGSQLPPTVR